MAKTAISFYFFILSFGLTSYVHADELLDTVSKKYQNAGLVEASIEKEDVTMMTAEPEKVTGHIFLSKTLFRIDTDAPKKGSMIYDGTYLWTVPDKEKSVTRIKLTAAASDKAFLSTMIDKDQRDKNFNLKTTSNEKKSDSVDYSFEAKDKKAPLRNFKIFISKEKKEISKVEYTDDAENQTTITFDKTKFSAKKKASLFNYKPAKGIQVNDL